MASGLGNFDGFAVLIWKRMLFTTPMTNTFRKYYINICNLIASNKIEFYKDGCIHIHRYIYLLKR